MTRFFTLCCAVLALVGSLPTAKAATPDTPDDTFVCTLDLAADTPSVTCAKEINNGTATEPTAALDHNDGCILRDSACMVPERRAIDLAVPIASVTDKSRRLAPTRGDNRHRFAANRRTARLHRYQRV